MRLQRYSRSFATSNFFLIGKNIDYLKDEDWKKRGEKAKEEIRKKKKPKTVAGSTRFVAEFTFQRIQRGREAPGFFFC